jgi:hypothetical protein
MEAIGKRLAAELDEAQKAKIGIIQLPKDDAAKFSKTAEDAMMVLKAPEGQEAER